MRTISVGFPRRNVWATILPSEHPPTLWMSAMIERLSANTAETILLTPSRYNSSKASRKLGSVVSDPQKRFAKTQ